MDERENNNLPAEGGQAGQKKQKVVRADSILTKESICAVFALFSILAFLVLVTKDLMFGEPGAYIHALLIGVFGYAAYPLSLLVAYNCVMGFLGKRLFKRRAPVVTLLFVCTLGILVAQTVQTLFVWSWGNDGYLNACFHAGEAFPASTVAGWLGALPVYLLSTLTTDVGALVILSALAVLLVYIFVRQCIGNAGRKTGATVPMQSVAQNVDQGSPVMPNSPQPTAYAPMQEGQGYVAPQPIAASQTPQEPVPPMEGYPQGAVSAQGMSGATPAMPYVVRQTPGYMIRDNNQAQAEASPTSAQAPQVGQTQPQTHSESGSYSPFGATSPMQQPTRSLTQAESRQILYSGTPQQNYQDNLFFDHSARVHRRTMPGGEQPSVMPQQPIQPVGQSQAPQAMSTTYSEQYQRSVQEGTPIRPQRVAGDSGEGFGRRAGNPYGLDVPSSPTDSGRDVGVGGRTETPFTARRSEPTDFGTPIARPSAFGSEELPISRTDRMGEGVGRRVPSADTTPPIEPSTPSRVSPFAEPAPSRVSPFAEPETPAEPTEGRARRHEYMDTFSLENPRIFGATGNRGESGGDEDVKPVDRSAVFDEEPPVPQAPTESKRDDLYALRSYDEEPKAADAAPTAPATPIRNEGAQEPQVSSRSERYSHMSSQPATPAQPAAPVQPVQPAPVVEEKKEEPVQPPKPRLHKPYVRVPLHYFNCSDNVPDSDVAEVESIKASIVQTLEDYNVSGCSIASVTFGPTVTRYNVILPRGISPRKVVSLEQEIAMGLCREGVNVYLNVEDGAVSIEVPNRKRQTVELGCMFIDDEYTKAKPTSLVFAMGKDIANRKVYGDVCKMTHLLVAGSSGSGKSVFLGCLIISLITKYSPDEMRLILIDPKKTEFVIYNNLPHLMVNEIITDTKKAVQSLSWAIGEMERRYTLLEKMSLSGTYVVNIDEYNANVGPGEEKLPKIVIIVDELADLMLNAKKDMEDKIQSLTQKARAAGIHLILATQRPSTDVITGVIKSNLPTRIAFTVATDVDSRVILDQTGAQKLLGKGDMVYTASGINTPVRVQSPYISSADSQKVVQFIKENNEAFFDESATSFINSARGGGVGDGSDGNGLDVEQVYLDALKLVIQTQTASISMVQRKCSVGFNKAGKIIEWMEQMEFISPYEGAKARTVYITQEKFVELFGQW